MEIHTFTTRKEEPLASFLRKAVPPLLAGEEVSKSKLRRLIFAGCISVNGRQCRIPSFLLKTGSTVRIALDREKFLFEKQPEDRDFTLTEKDVLFEDETLIIVNKPPFLPTEKTIVTGRKNMHQCVVDYLWQRNPSLRNPPYAGIMHRLDRETSGVLLFTKSRSINKAMHDIFAAHKIQKIYRAVSKSAEKAVPAQFSLEDFLGRISPRSAPCKMGTVPESKGGQYARTDVTLLGKADGLYYFDCQPLTGRTHQIRVQLAGAGFPLAGDILYGGAANASPLPRRIMLHALRLEFCHPVSGEALYIEAPLPEAFSFPEQLSSPSSADTSPCLRV